MRNKETGEFELVVGNGVLLSGFFIVVLLFAVAFAMGFIVARAKYQQDPQSVAATSSPGGSIAAQVPPSRPVETPASSVADPAPAEDRTPPPASTTPAQPEGASASPRGSAEIPSASPADASAVQEAPPGLYWQVTSTADGQAARVFLQTIKDMGLPTTLSPGPNHFTRVLVGPYPDTAALGRVKTQLENAGMHPVRHNQ